MKEFLILVLLIVGVVAAIAISSGINEISSAKAYQKIAIANQRAADAELRRAIAAEKESERVAVWNDTYPARVGAWVLWILSFGIAMALLTIISLSSASVFVMKTSIIKSNEMKMRAGLIHADSNNLFPMMFDNVDNPKFLIDPNSGGVWKLDERQEPNAQMIASRGQLQTAGVLAKEARKSNTSKVEDVNPMIVKGEVAYNG